ncbi:MAG TPA: Flp family type IVb pilin [Stellaceae bacterium]|nr:Flp family type IVb pilin [Stellaceae bacterium]
MLRMYLAGASFKNAAFGAIHGVRHDASGVTAIEYGLIAGLIAVVIIGVLALLGGDLKSLFTTVGSGLTSAAGSS